jgi:hypothetical protein
MIAQHYGIKNTKVSTQFNIQCPKRKKLFQTSLK